MEVKPTIRMILFRRHLIFLLTSLSVVLILYGLFQLSINYSLISDKYSYASLNTVYERLQRDISNVDEYFYLQYDKDQLINSNCSYSIEKIGMKWYEGGIIDNDFYFLKVENEDNIFVVLLPNNYVFLNDYLKKNFNSPVLLYCGFFLIIEIILFVVIYSKLHRILSKHLSNLNLLINSYESGDISISPIPASIYEFDKVQKSFDSLRISLAESEKDRWKKNDQLKRQIASVSHDLKVPLSIVKGNTELLQRNLTDLKNERRLNSIMRQINRMENFLSTFLDFSKMQTIDHFAMDKYKIKNIKEIIENIGTDLLSINTRKIYIVDDYNEDDYLLIHAVYLQRALYNLFKNALDYSKSPIICFLQSDKKWLKIYIIDFGVGMDTDEIEKCTELFFSGDSSRKSGEHYGIGLSFVSEVVDMHHGNLTIKSQKDEYTNIVIKIPLLDNI